VPKKPLKTLKSLKNTLIIPLILLLFLLPSLFLNFFFFDKLKDNWQEIEVIGVIDGDTIVLDGKTRLRLRCVDAPELEYCGGTEAKALMEKLVDGKKVVIKEQIIDARGRPMALVYVDGKLINEEIIKSGWGRYHSDKTSVREVLKSAYKHAREKKLGIFSSQCSQMQNPDNPKCNIKANIDKNSTRRNYYFPGCAQYDYTIVELDLGEGWFCTEKEAKAAGYTRSKTCP